MGITFEVAALVGLAVLVVVGLLVATGLVGPGETLVQKSETQIGRLLTSLDATHVPNAAIDAL